MADLRNPECTKCSLSQGCSFVCHMLEPEQRDLLVIGDYTSGEVIDVMGKKVVGAIKWPLRESKFDLFWKIAESVCNVNPDKVWATYLTKCNPGENKPTTEQNLTCASTYLRKEILAVRPKAILLLGAAAASAFGFNDNITKAAGQTKEVTFGKGDNAFTTTLVATYSPNYIQYNEHLLKKFAYDIDKAWKLATGLSAGAELPTKVTICTTMEQVYQLIEYVKETGYCVPDFESTKLTDMNVFDPNFKVTLLAISFQHGSAYTIPLFHFDSPFTEAQVMEILELVATEIWGNPTIHKINQNIKFDMRVQQRYTPDVVFRGRFDCTMIMHSLYDDLTKHGIKEWLPGFFPRFMGWELQVKGKGWDLIPLNTLSDYAGIDADGAFRGYTVLLTKLLEDKRVYNLYRNLYMFALPTLLGMEMRGMPIGRDIILGFEARALELIEQQTKKMNAYPQVRHYSSVEQERVKEAKLSELRAKRTAATTNNRLKQADKYYAQIQAVKTNKVTLFTEINLGSPDQLCGLLYSADGFKFKPPYDKKTRGAKEQTGEIPLKSLKDKTGFIQDLFVLRSIQSTYSKYLKGIRIQLDENDRVHTTYNQARVKTGRLSSGGENQGPNLQNIVTHVKIKNPLVEEVTVMAKKAFIVPKGYTLLNCVSYGTLIATNRGYIKIENVTTDDCIVYQGMDYKVLDAVCNGEQECYKITTNTGREIITTIDHRFKTIGGFTRVSDFGRDQIIYIDRPSIEHHNYYINDGSEHMEQYVAGVIMGDGHYAKDTKGGYQINIAFGRDYKQLAPIFNKYFKKDGIRRGLKGDYIMSDKRAYSYFTEQYPKHSSKHLWVPDYIWQSSVTMRRAFLAGVLDSDGSYASDRLTICSISKVWVLQLQLLANSIGCYGVVKRVVADTNFIKGHVSYQLTFFTNESVMNFPVGFLYRKSVRREKSFTQCRTDFIPFELIEPFAASGIQKSILGNRLFTNGRRKQHVTRQALVQSKLDCEAANFMYETVVSVVPCGVRNVYDLTIDKVSVFVANGIVVHNCDQSQAELRMMAEYANEERMIAAYNSGKDLHIETACAISHLTMKQFEILPEKERDELRQKAKSANFGLIYGQSAEGFKEYAENKYGVVMSLAEATRTRDAFFEAYPAILAYHDTYIAKGKKFGYVRTLFGRRAHYPDVNSPHQTLRGNAERELINCPIQGSNGENTVLALALLERRLPKSIELSNSVHDSIMMLCPNHLVPYAVKIGIDTCENTPMLKYFGKEMEKLKFKTDCQFSLTNWKELKKYDEESWREALNKIK